MSEDLTILNHSQIIWKSYLTLQLFKKD